MIFGLYPTPPCTGFASAITSPILLEKLELYETPKPFGGRLGRHHPGGKSPNFFWSPYQQGWFRAL